MLAVTTPNFLLLWGNVKPLDRTLASPTLVFRTSRLVRLEDREAGLLCLVATGLAMEIGRVKYQNIVRDFQRYDNERFQIAKMHSIVAFSSENGEKGVKTCKHKKGMNM